MERRYWFALLVAGLLAGCRSAPPVRLPELSPAPRPAARFPASDGAHCRLVAYRGLEVSYVQGAAVETYVYRGVFYCYVKDRWFLARALSGPWSYVEMKYVPTDLFRARGHLPEGMRASK